MLVIKMDSKRVYRYTVQNGHIKGENDEVAIIRFRQTQMLIDGSVLWAGSLRARVGGFEAVFPFDPVLEDPSALIKGCENRVFLFVYFLSSEFSPVYRRARNCRSEFVVF